MKDKNFVSFTWVGILCFLSFFLMQCNGPLIQETHMKSQPYTNALINETSPYLLQHAHNPVEWYPWGEAALEKAKKENKLLLISVGYAACHWCHVMEHESFEDTAVAKIMNAHFICIKVDREERPDIDQIYMSAVQLMTGQGGWPLNCFALPDGRPIYGGTYFKQEQWVDVLQKLAYEYAQNPDKVEEYAQRLTQGVRESEVIEKMDVPPDFSPEILDEMVAKWKASFDKIEGGSNRAPKFPLPNNYAFLMRYAALSHDDQVDAQVKLTLDKMAFGGIYDQIGGGFARYSVDKYWKAPHFEKMLYDNAQLISLYSEAYTRYRDPLYKEVVYQTIGFCKRELYAGDGIYYSSLDADSEGREGAFYVWKESLFEAICGADAPVMKAYYNIGEKALWEEDENILLRNKSNSELAQLFQISEDELASIVKKNNALLFAHRAKRIPPGLDDKSLTSWNALMLIGLVDAYAAFGDVAFLEEAEKVAHFIVNQQTRVNGGLNHNFKNGVSNINGFLEDYSFVIEGFTKLYQASFDEKWLHLASGYAEYVITHFRDEETGMFYFTSKEDAHLIARKVDFTDNVMPSSNASLANGMFVLGTVLANKNYLDMSRQMLQNVAPYMGNYGSGFSHWGNLLLNEVYPFYEIAIVGAEVQKVHVNMQQYYIPNKLFVGASKESDLALLQGKGAPEETLIYVCVNKSCQLPTSSVEEALNQIK